MLLFTDRKQFEVLGSQLWFAFDQRICGPSSPAIFNALSHMWHFSYLSYCCDKIADKSHLKEEEFVLFPV